jgi:hypothetical protein
LRNLEFRAHHWAASHYIGRRSLSGKPRVENRSKTKSAEPVDIGKVQCWPDTKPSCCKSDIYYVTQLTLLAAPIVKQKMEHSVEMRNVERRTVQAGCDAFGCFFWLFGAVRPIRGGQETQRSTIFLKPKGFRNEPNITKLYSLRNVPVDLLHQVGSCTHRGVRRVVTHTGVAE